jgi:hypothetical protein
MCAVRWERPVKAVLANGSFKRIHSTYLSPPGQTVKGECLHPLNDDGNAIMSDKAKAWIELVTLAISTGCALA